MSKKIETPLQRAQRMVRQSKTPKYVEKRRVLSDNLGFAADQMPNHLLWPKG